MKLLAVDEYIKFECIGGKCPISCCGGNWGITIDDESYDYYMSVEGEFGNVLRSGIIKLNGTNAFRLDEKTRDCVFLNENKLCSIYRNLGPDSLCETCRTYPRAFYDVGDIEFCYLTNSCPEVNRMIVQRIEPFNTLYDDSEEDENIVEEGFDKPLSALMTGLDIIKNRNIKIRDRMILMLIFAAKFQECMRKNTNFNDVMTAFSDLQIYKRLLDSGLAKQESDIAGKIRVFMIVYRSLMWDSYDHPMWKRCACLAESITHNEMPDVELIKGAYASVLNENIQIELEQLMAYRFFVVFMQGFEAADYYDKVVYEIIMLITLETFVILTDVFQHHKCSQNDRILFYSLCGRIEHTVKQKESLVKELRDGGFYEQEKIIKLVS